MGTVKLPPDLCGNYEIVLMILSIMVILTFPLGLLTGRAFNWKRRLKAEIPTSAEVHSSPLYRKHQTLRCNKC